jgi:hypothetical protein
MVKNKLSSPLLSDDEVESLVQQADKKAKIPVKRPIKKPAEKIIEPLPMEKPKPKPIKKELKKEQEKIVQAIKNLEPEKPEIKLENIKTPDIEYEFKKVTKFDLNWYYLKEKFVRFKKWLGTPYRMYVAWFNKKFNSPSDKDIKEFMDFFDDIPTLEQQIKNDVNIQELAKTSKTIIPPIKNDISMKEVEKIFEEMKPAIIAQIYENIERENKKRIRKLIIKGVE